jgi:hypothetical protein
MDIDERQWPDLFDPFFKFQNVSVLPAQDDYDA